MNLEFNVLISLLMIIIYFFLSYIQIFIIVLFLLNPVIIFIMVWLNYSIIIKYIITFRVKFLEKRKCQPLKKYLSKINNDYFSDK